MSGKQSIDKKEWMKRGFDDGLVFYARQERGKCFIEYIPAENAWIPIDADGYLYINCLWIAGSMKGNGYSNDLLAECIRDAETQNKKGICILCSEGKKREFLADPKFLAYKGFKTADVSDCGITLMYLPLRENAEPPKFKPCAKHSRRNWARCTPPKKKASRMPIMWKSRTKWNRTSATTPTRNTSLLKHHPQHPKSLTRKRAK